MKSRKFKHSLTFVVLLSIIALIVIVETVTSMIGYYQFEKTILREYRNNTNMVAHAAANTIDPGKLDEYLRSKGKDSSYRATKARLQNLADSSGSMVVYVARLNKEDSTRTYFFNAIGEGSGLDAYTVGYTDEASDGFIERYTSLEEGEDTSMYTQLQNSSIGPYTTTLTALRDDSGKIVAACGVVMPMTALITARRAYLHQIVIWLLLILAVAGVGWFAFFRTRLVLPLRQIADEAFRFSNDRTVAEIPLVDRIKSHSEIGELAKTVDEMEETIVSNVDKLLNLTKEKNRIETELSLATKIQANVLPRISESFPGRREIDIFASMEPAKEVGGDFYDFFFIDEDHFAMVIADVAGKGVPAALYMMVSKVLIKATCLNGIMDPGEVLTSVNQKLCENDSIDMFVTVWLGILDLRTGRLAAANAGHEYPIVSNGSADDTASNRASTSSGAVHSEAGQKMELLKDKHGFVLGGMTGIKEKSYELTLLPGDRIFVYTDGVAEAMDAEKTQFGTDRLIAVLNDDTSADSNPQAYVQRVNDAIAEFVKGEEQFDDITMLCLRYNGPSQ